MTGCRNPCHDAPRLRSDQQRAISRTKCPSAHQTKTQRRQQPAGCPRGREHCEVRTQRQRARQQGRYDDSNEPSATQARQGSYRRGHDRQALPEAQRVQPKNAVRAEDHHSACPGVLHTSLVHVVLRLNDLADHHWIAARCDHAPTFVHQRQRPLSLSLDGLFVADLDAVDRGATNQGTRFAEDGRTAQHRAPG